MTGIQKTHSPEETRALASDLAKRIIQEGPAAHGATVVALRGELGAGKTTFTQGFFQGLGIKRVPASPTFILMRRTKLPSGKTRFRNIFHIDAYRLRPGDRDDLGLKALFADPAHLFLIEWPDNLGPLLPRRVFRIRLSHGSRENERVIALPSLP